MRKNILFIIENLRGGGAEKALIDLLERFDYTRYDVSLCVGYLEGIYQNNIPEKVKLITLYQANHSFCRKAFRYYKRYHFSYMLKYQLRKKVTESYDVIISFLEGRSLLLHNLIRCQGKINITWVHCDLLNYHWTASAFPDIQSEKNCYTHMDKVVFVSQRAMQNFFEKFQMFVPSVCIYNIVDINHIQRLAADEKVEHSCFTVTSIGTLNSVKAFDRIIRIAKRFQEESYHIRFQIIGEGGEEKLLKKQCCELGVQDTVFFLDFMNNPYPYLKESDIYVSTSRSEGFSLVICEAMCLGIPVVATPTAGAIELLDGGEYGVLVGHDDDSIYQGIKKLINDKQLRQLYAEKATFRSDIFNAEEVMRKVYKLFN